MMEIELARLSDAEEIAELYASLVGMPGCTWDENYPSLDFVRGDIEKCSLYKAVENGRIIAAAYLGDFEEVEMPDCFDRSVKRFGEFGRVGVRREYHRQGVAKTLLSYLIGEAARREFDGIALFVGTENFSAVKLYEKIGFKRCGESYLYETHWYCYEYKMKG